MRKMQSTTTGRSGIVYHRGDVVLIPFPFTDLSSVKTRPVVVLSTDGYANKTGNIIVAMITSVEYTSPYDCPISDWKSANLLAPSWVRVKIATLDPKLVRFQPGKLNERDIREIDKRIALALGVKS